VEERVEQRRVETDSTSPPPNTFAGGALGSSVGAVLGFLLAGPAGAAIVGGLGTFIGGLTRAQIDEATKEAGGEKK